MNENEIHDKNDNWDYSFPFYIFIILIIIIESVDIVDNSRFIL